MPERQILHETPFADTVRQFHDAGVRFVVIGGVAMGLHGSNYVTHDTDFAHAVEAEDDLIAMKRAANRPKDQNHLFELMALKNKFSAQTTPADARVEEEGR